MKLTLYKVVYVKNVKYNVKSVNVKNNSNVIMILKMLETNLTTSFINTKNL